MSGLQPDSEEQPHKAEGIAGPAGCRTHRNSHQGGPPVGSVGRPRSHKTGRSGLSRPEEPYSRVRSRPRLHELTTYQGLAARLQLHHADDLTTSSARTPAGHPRERGRGVRRRYWLNLSSPSVSARQSAHDCTLRCIEVGDEPSYWSASSAGTSRCHRVCEDQPLPRAGGTYPDHHIHSRSCSSRSDPGESRRGSLSTTPSSMS